MGYEYKCFDRGDSPVKSDQCKASVLDGGRSVRFHQCQRRPWKDGWCKQHHPDTEAERRAQKELRYREERELDPRVRLDRAHEEIARLKALMGELAEVSWELLRGGDEDPDIRVRANALLARYQKEVGDD